MRTPHYRNGLVGLLIALCLCGTFVQVDQTFATQPELGTFQQPAAPEVRTPDLEDAKLCDVVGILTGNAIRVRHEGKQQDISLTAVLVPSIQSSQQNDKDAAIAAKRFLVNLLAGEKVWVVYGEPNQRDTDGRRLADIYRAPDKLWVNLEMVRQGYAEFGPHAVSPENVNLYLTYQQRARQSEKGLWRNRTANDQPAPQPAQPREAEPKPVPQQVTVYITRTGSKYHRSSCSYLRQSRIPIDLEAAKRSYGPCSRCNPPR